MNRLRLRLSQFTRSFWFIPAVMTVAALLVAAFGVEVERQHGVRKGLEFVYTGGETGARSVLAAIASSSIGVAGTIFSITIAALSYAAGSMGPRLLDNFTRDRGNQITLGTFIATFAFSLYTLRAVTGGEQSPFVPHYNVTVALALAMACIAALVYYLAHVTGSINMTRVVNLLRDDLRVALDAATRQNDPDRPSHAPALSGPDWASGEALRATAGGYLQLVDIAALVRRAHAADVVVRLDVRSGDYVFPNAVIAHGVPRLPADVMSDLTLGNDRTADQDLEYVVRQLVEVASRALSPGVNDPNTAIDVIDRFGDALCRLRDRSWSDGLHREAGQLRLVMPCTSFGGLLDAMFHQIRQYGRSSPAVMIRLLEVLRIAASCMHSPGRRAELRRHAVLVREDALRGIENSQDRRDLETRYRALCDDDDRQ